MQISASDNVTLSVNPATGETLSVWNMADAAGVEALVEQAHRAAAGWRRHTPAQRAEALRAASTDGTPANKRPAA